MISAYEINEAINNGTYDTFLFSIQQTCVQRLMAIKPKRGSVDQTFKPTKKSPELRVGDRAEFNWSTRPQYLIGLQGRITKINPATARLILDHPESAGRFGRNPKGIRVPYSLLTKI